MKTEQIIILVVAFFLGMLLINMVKNVCGCEIKEGFLSSDINDFVNIMRDSEYCNWGSADLSTVRNSLVSCGINYDEYDEDTGDYGHYSILNDGNIDSVGAAKIFSDSSCRGAANVIDSCPACSGARENPTILGTGCAPVDDSSNRVPTPTVTVCDGVVDCAGVCGGGAVIDCSGVCNGGAVVDACGMCSNGGQNRDSPCLNGGVCSLSDSSNNNGYTCDCASGYTGDNCETPPDPCVPNPCQNGGRCNNGACDCTGTGGYTGDNCEIAPNPCEPNPCLNGGSCSNNSGNAVCTCTSGWSGGLCNERSVEGCMDRNACNYNREATVDNGSCIQLDCLGQCDPENRAVEDVCGLCDRGQQTGDNPCKNGGVCSLSDSSNNGYTCDCAGGWTGDTCETENARTEDSPPPNCGVGPGYTMRENVIDDICRGVGPSGYPDVQQFDCTMSNSVYAHTNDPDTYYCCDLTSSTKKVCNNRR